MTFFLSGCIKYEYDMSIKEDKSITINLIDAFEIGADLGDDYEIPSKEKYEELGYEVKNYDDGKYQGLQLSKTYDSVDQISSSDCGTVDLSTIIDQDTAKLVLFKSEKKDTVTTYTADFIFDLTNSTSDGEKEHSGEIVGMSNEEPTIDDMIFKYSITFPNNVQVVSENATEKTNDNHTLTWNLTYGKRENIKFVFRIDDKEVTALIDEEEESDENTPKDEDSDDTSDQNPTDEEEKGEEKMNVHFEKLVLVVTILAVLAIIISLIVLKTLINKRIKKIKRDTFDHQKPPSTLRK